MVRFILCCFLGVVSFQGKTQENSDSLLLITLQGISKPDYDYSSMGDTVIIEYGNCGMGGQQFYKMEDSLRGGRMCFARRELTVEKGKLVKELIYDSNSGYVTVTRYNESRMINRKSWYYQATNAPHPERYKE